MKTHKSAPETTHPQASPVNEQGAWFPQRPGGAFVEILSVRHPKDMDPKKIQVISLLIPLLFSVSGSVSELGTRQRTICVVALATNTPAIYPSDL